MEKSSRIGMRVAPVKKQKWEQAAQMFGYKSLSAYIEAMLDWSIAYDEYDGNYEAYVKEKGLG